MVTVRPAVAEDFGAIAALTNTFIRDTAVHFGYEEVTAEELRGAWRASRARHPFLVAEVDGAFAGYAKAGVWRDRAAYQWTCETGIYLEPNAQGKGVGRTLYGALIDVLRAQGFRSIVAGATLPNEASVRLHESLGFKNVGVAKDAGWKHGAWHDVIFWQLMLAQGPGGGGALKSPEEAWRVLRSSVS
jgi:phosphinothricin acetyltransferase